MDPKNDPTKAPADPAADLSLPSVDPAQAASAAQPQPPAAMPTPVPTAGTQPVVPQPTADDITPLIADDNDLIEKEWVEKAKQLVDHTKNDPYTQNKEINKFKAAYIKKRYNKDIQLSKD